MKHRWPDLKVLLLLLVGAYARVLLGPLSEPREDHGIRHRGHTRKYYLNVTQFTAHLTLSGECRDTLLA